MTGPGWPVAVLLAGAATVVVWPVRGIRSRRRALLDAAARPGVTPAATYAPGELTHSRRTTAQRGRRGRQPTPDRPLPARPPNRRDSAHPSAALRLGSEPGPRRRALFAPRHALPAAALLAGGAGAVLGGPVGAIVLAAYGALAARGIRRRHARESTDQARRRELDQLCTLAADLRAGLPVTPALVDGPDRLARLARAAVRLADRTGAPLAELLERIEADARATDRGLAAAGAQAAGARATAWLLAGLPLGGIGLGYAIGVDPVAVLLHTPVGGGSALTAVALQVGGLLWAERLGAPPGRAD